MRVVAGRVRGRRLMVPEGEHTRPTSDRVREAVFNSLFSLSVLDDARVLDLFAGSGALGIEALSRGAATATFVESDRNALEALRHNLDTTGFADVATVIVGDAPSHLPALAADHDLFVLDPPYDYDGWSDLLAGVGSGTVVIESDREVTVPAHWHTHRVRRYSGTVVTLATAPRDGDPES